MKTEKQMEAARSECEEADLVLAQAKEAFEAANALAEGGGE